jgi:hypothetical protein
VPGWQLATGLPLETFQPKETRLVMISEYSNIRKIEIAITPAGSVFYNESTRVTCEENTDA